MIPLESRVEKFIREEGLLKPEELLLVAVSGGADSVALLLILKRLGYRIEAVHCNFHLRGEESDRDEAFVRQLCESNNIIIHLIHFDTKAYASLHQVSIEMAARELRYRYFEQLRQDIGAADICVAHHRDDAVETLLMNLLRGAGIHGLTGIRPRNGHIVRPLLCVGRQEIEEFLHSIDQSYVVDSTNLETDALRNRIRLHLIPQLCQLNPSASENIARSARYLAEAEKVYNAYFLTKGTVPSVCEVSLQKVLDSPSPLSLLHEWLSPLGFNRAQVELIMAHIRSGEASGRTFQSPTHVLGLGSESLVVEPLRPAMKPMTIPETGNYRLADNAMLRVELSDGKGIISRESHIATLDAALVTFPLTLRPATAGDRFHPFGMKGQKLVSDYLTDRKMNILEKRRQLVISDASGQIVWLVGQRTDNRYKVSDQTESILRLTLLRGVS